MLRIELQPAVKRATCALCHEPILPTSTVIVMAQVERLDSPLCPVDIMIHRGRCAACYIAAF